MNIKELTVTELKAMVYDEMVKAEVAKQNIQILNEELNIRGKEKSMVELEETKVEETK